MPERQEQNFIVLSDGFSFPYSRGLMARSLIRAGLGSESAYQVASSVQSMLLGEGVTEIMRRKLKQRTMELIERELGEKLADSYEKWKLQGEAIYVVDGRKHEPFSRGILSQSLLAAGLSPEIAHEVAERMAVDLSERGVRNISRDQLRRLTFSRLRDDFGQEYARHYLLWRTLKGPDMPLILLFSGATGTGKSSLAVEIAHRLGITRVIGTDTIREIMRGMFSRELLPSIHESSYTVWKSLERPFDGNADPVLSAFQEQSQRVDVGVQAIMRRAAKENLSMIIEGVHLLPARPLCKLDKDAIIIQVLICTLDEQRHRSRFVYRGEDAPQRRTDKYLENFESIRSIQDALVENSREQDIFVIDNVDFDDSVYKIIRYLTDKMAERVEIDYSRYELPKEEARL